MSAISVIDCVLRKINTIGTHPALTAEFVAGQILGTLTVERRRLAEEQPAVDVADLERRLAAAVERARRFEVLYDEAHVALAACGPQIQDLAEKSHSWAIQRMRAQIYQLVKIAWISDKGMADIDDGLNVAQVVQQPRVVPAHGSQDGKAGGL